MKVLRSMPGAATIIKAERAKQSSIVVYHRGAPTVKKYNAFFSRQEHTQPVQVGPIPLDRELELLLERDRAHHRPEHCPFRFRLHARVLHASGSFRFRMGITVGRRRRRLLRE